MKNFLFTAILFVVATVQTGFAQNAPASSSLSPILVSYYHVKDALVSGDANAAAAQAGEMLHTIDHVDMKKLSEKEHAAFMPLQNKLAFDARHISEMKVLDHQREHFSALSTNMASLAKAVNLSADPIYKDYCPMKKAIWLSPEQVIKNPYYGSAMLSCGKVTETMKH